MGRMVIELIADDTMARGQIAAFLQDYAGGVRHIDQSLGGMGDAVARIGSQFSRLVMGGGAVFALYKMITSISGEMDTIRGKVSGMFQTQKDFSQGWQGALPNMPSNFGDTKAAAYEKLKQTYGDVGGKDPAAFWEIVRTGFSTMGAATDQQFYSAVAEAQKEEVRTGQHSPDFVTALMLTSKAAGYSDTRATRGFFDEIKRNVFAEDNQEVARNFIPNMKRVMGYMVDPKNGVKADPEAAAELIALMSVVGADKTGATSGTAAMSVMEAIDTQPMGKDGNLLPKDMPFWEKFDRFQEWWQAMDREEQNSWMPKLKGRLKTKGALRLLLSGDQQTAAEITKIRNDITLPTEAQALKQYQEFERERYQGEPGAIMRDTEREAKLAAGTQLMALGMPGRIREMELAQVGIAGMLEKFPLQSSKIDELSKKLAQVRMGQNPDLNAETAIQDTGLALMAYIKSGDINPLRDFGFGEAAADLSFDPTTKDQIADQLGKFVIGRDPSSDQATAARQILHTRRGDAIESGQDPAFIANVKREYDRPNAILQGLAVLERNANDLVGYTGKNVFRDFDPQKNAHSVKAPDSDVQREQLRTLTKIASFLRDIAFGRDQQMPVIPFPDTPNTTVVLAPTPAPVLPGSQVHNPGS